MCMRVSGNGCGCVGVGVGVNSRLTRTGTFGEWRNSKWYMCLPQSGAGADCTGCQSLLEVATACQMSTLQSARGCRKTPAVSDCRGPRPTRQVSGQATTRCAHAVRTLRYDEEALPDTTRLRVCPAFASLSNVTPAAERWNTAYDRLRSLPGL